MNETLSENSDISERVREIQQLFLNRGFIEDISAAVAPGDRAVKSNGWTVRIIPHSPVTNRISLAFYKNMEVEKVSLREKLMRILGKPKEVHEQTSQEPPTEILESTGKFKCRSERRTGLGKYYEVEVTEGKNN